MRFICTHRTLISQTPWKSGSSKMEILVILSLPTHCFKESVLDFRLIWLSSYQQDLDLGQQTVLLKHQIVRFRLFTTQPLLQLLNSAIVAWKKPQPWFFLKVNRCSWFQKIYLQNKQLSGCDIVIYKNYIYVVIQMTKMHFSLYIFGLCPKFLDHSSQNPWNFLHD